MSGEDLTDEQVVRVLAAAADAWREAREERASAPSLAVIRGLARATGHDHETVVWALLRRDVSALFGLSSSEAPRVPRLLGDVRPRDPQGSHATPKAVRLRTAAAWHQSSGGPPRPEGSASAPHRAPDRTSRNRVEG